MANPTDAEALERLIPFTIDGELYETEDHPQEASNLLTLAGLDPDIYDLAEVPDKGPPREPFANDEIVTVHKDEHFVSVRKSAPVA
ncbi:MAG: hypothetical protein OXG52_07845 [bacterium]|nr:hypothetical protein [bacterium]